ncbi:MAG: hypothetical protein HS110_15580 [Zoogloeaceae bacterium]|nr:hypothetical protein [Zoogloeaceae bacterium]
MSIHSLKAEAQALAKSVRKLGYTQSDLAIAMNASQSQISRILSGQLQRRSRLFDALCVYVFSAKKGISADTVRANAELMDALATTWDGTAVHAAALAAVIRSLGALQEHPKLIKSNAIRRKGPHAAR